MPPRRRRSRTSGTPNLARLQLTRTQLEEIWVGADRDTWGEVVAWINDGNGTADEASDTRCAGSPDLPRPSPRHSGTTFAFKDYLDNLNPARGWLSTYVTPDTATWPNPEKTVAWDYNNDNGGVPEAADAVTKCAAQTPQFPGDGANGKTACDETAIPTLQSTEVLPTAGNGNDDLINKVADFDGSIGYGDLSTVRQQRTFAFERQTGAGDDKFWVKLQTKNLAGFADPQSAPTGFTPGGARGSNCLAANLTGLPVGGDPTTRRLVGGLRGRLLARRLRHLLADVRAGLGRLLRPVRALPDQAAEERKARTVKDYMNNALSNLGQAGLGAFDYSPLSDSIRTIAQGGADAIGWQKTTGGGGGGTPTPTPTPVPVQPGTGRRRAAPGRGRRATRSRSPSRASRRATCSSACRCRVPATCAVRLTARIKGRTVTIASGASSRSSGGTVRFTLKPSKAAKAALKRGALRVTVRTTYTPDRRRGGDQVVDRDAQEDRVDQEVASDASTAAL